MLNFHTLVDLGFVLKAKIPAASRSSLLRRLEHDCRSKGACPRDSTGGQPGRRQEPPGADCPRVNWTAQKKMGSRTRFWTAQRRKPNVVLKTLKTRKRTVKTLTQRATTTTGKKCSKKQNKTKAPTLSRRKGFLRSPPSRTKARFR